ncbi:hypothetical protein P280DRAFT_554630, partial [Massarina eburnea CBS 473.64]
MLSALTYASLGLGVSASAIVPHILPRGSEGTFTLEAVGKASGPIGQLDDGQNRIGGNLPLGHLHWKGDTIVDDKGRGCIITPPNTTQWQCDSGVKGVPGFEFGCDNKLLYHGSPDFWACPVDDHGQWNIYIKPAF